MVFLGTSKVEYERSPVHIYAHLRLTDDLNDNDAMLQTVDHKQVRRGDIPSIAVTWDYGTKSEIDRGMGSGGAGISKDVVARMTDQRLRTKAERIIELADRWHLNTMVPGCAHQDAVWHCTKDAVLTPSGWTGGHVGVDQGWPAIRERHGEHPYPRRGDECDVCGRNRWDEPTDACPVSGYRWGTSWLAEIPPDEVVAELRELFDMQEVGA